MNTLNNSSDIDKFIKNISSIELDNSIECKERIHHLIDNFLKKGIYWLHHPLKAGTYISRCRKNPNSLDKEDFTYNNPKYVKDFQRASIPNETIFYGSVGDESSKEYGNMISMIETSKLHRNNYQTGREEIYVSHWKVKEDIKMQLIVHPEVFCKSEYNNSLRQMKEHYFMKLKDYPIPEIIPEFQNLVKIISEQFSKKVTNGNNYEYLISAYFSHYLITPEKGLIYPSVQVSGNLGFNIALHPLIVDEKLEFIEAKKHILYKLNNYMQVPADTYTDGEIAKYMDVNLTEIRNLEWIN